MFLNSINIMTSFVEIRRLSASENSLLNLSNAGPHHSYWQEASLVKQWYRKYLGSPDSTNYWR
mgnify:CR=1 FL=1